VLQEKIMEMSRRFQRLQEEQIAASEALREREGDCASLQEHCSHLQGQLSGVEAEVERLNRALTVAKVTRAFSCQKKSSCQLTDLAIWTTIRMGRRTHAVLAY
jgi:chromosome segregation ATPase